MTRLLRLISVFALCVTIAACTKTNNLGSTNSNCGGKKCAEGEDCLNGQCTKLGTSGTGTNDVESSDVTAPLDATKDSTTGQEDPCKACTAEPCQVKTGWANTGITGLCDGAQCVAACTPCKDFFSVDFSKTPLTCHTSCSNDSQCYPFVGKCNTQTGKCEQIQLANGTVCQIHEQCLSGHCTPAVGPDAGWVAGTKVCTERPDGNDCRPDNPSSESNEFCFGGMIGTGKCTKLVRTSVPQGNTCQQVCRGWVPEKGCPVGHQFLKAGNLELAHTEFTNRLKYDATDSACNFGAAMTTLFLSFQDTSLNFDTQCANTELSGPLHGILREIGGPANGLPLSSKLFGDYGLLKALKQARAFDPATKVTVASYTEAAPNTPKTVEFTVDHILVSEKSIRMADIDTGRTLTIRCESKSGWQQGVPAVIQDRPTGPCFAWFAMNPDEGDPLKRNYYTAPDEGQNSKFTWSIWSVIKDAKVKGTGSLLLYQRSKSPQDGSWVYDTTAWIKVDISNLTDTLSALTKDLAGAGGDLVGIAMDGGIGAAFILGKSPNYSFDTLKNIAIKFDENNLRAIVTYLAAAAADPSFSFKLPGEMFQLPGVSFKFSYVDMQLLAAVFGSLRAVINYMASYDWDFKPEKAIGEKDLICGELRDALNAKFMTVANPGGTGFTTGQANATSYLTAALTALSNAAGKAAITVADAECAQRPSTPAGLWAPPNQPITVCISEWSKVLPTQVQGVGAIKAVIDGILASIAGGEQTLPNLLITAENDIAVKTNFGAMLSAKYVNSHNPQPVECAPNKDSQSDNKYNFGGGNCDVPADCVGSGTAPAALYDCRDVDPQNPGQKTGWCEYSYQSCMTSADCKTGDVCDLSAPVNGRGICRAEKNSLTSAYRDAWLGKLFTPNFLFDDKVANPTVKVPQEGGKPLDIKAEDVFKNFYTFVQRQILFMTDGDDEKDSGNGTKN